MNLWIHVKILNLYEDLSTDLHGDLHFQHAFINVSGACSTSSYNIYVEHFQHPLINLYRECIYSVYRSTWSVYRST